MAITITITESGSSADEMLESPQQGNGYIITLSGCTHSAHYITMAHGVIPSSHRRTYCFTVGDVSGCCDTHTQNTFNQRQKCKNK